MDKCSFETLSEAVNTLTQKEGYKEDFEADENCIKALYSKKEYQPKDLVIINSYRFEGMTNPSDSSILYVIETNDGKKGLLVDSYSAETSSVPEEMIEKLKIQH